MTKHRGSIPALMACVALVGTVLLLAPSTPAGAAGPTRVALGDATVVEGDAGKPTTIQFAVTLDAPAVGTATVGYTVTPGSAAHGRDIDARSGTVTFKPSAATGVTATTKYVSVKVLPDTLPEATESFTVALHDPSSNLSLADATALGTVLDDDTSAELRVSIGDASVTEGQAGKGNGAKLRLALSAPAPTPVAVTVAASDGTASATAGDYKAMKPKLVTFQAGQFQKTVTIKALPDSVDEVDETVLVRLSAPTTGLQLGRSAGVATIVDDDASEPTEPTDPTEPADGDLSFTVDLPRTTHCTWPQPPCDSPPASYIDWDSQLHLDLSASATRPTAAGSPGMAVRVSGAGRPASSYVLPYQFGWSGSGSGSGFYATGCVGPSDPRASVATSEVYSGGGPVPGGDFRAWTVAPSAALDAVETAPGVWSVRFQTVAPGTTTSTSTKTCADPAALCGLSYPGNQPLPCSSTKVLRMNYGTFGELGAPPGTCSGRTDARGTAVVFDCAWPSVDAQLTLRGSIPLTSG